MDCSAIVVKAGARAGRGGRLGAGCRALCYNTLVFLEAGVVEHTAGTGDMDRLGGLVHPDDLVISPGLTSASAADDARSPWLGPGTRCVLTSPGGAGRLAEARS